MIGCSRQNYGGHVLGFGGLNHASIASSACPSVSLPVRHFRREYPPSDISRKPNVYLRSHFRVRIEGVRGSVRNEHDSNLSGVIGLDSDIDADLTLGHNVVRNLQV